MGKIVNFNNAAMEDEKTEAFAWALETQRSHGYYSEPIHLILNEGDFVDDGGGKVVISLFENKDGRAIMRRDWPEDMCLRFNKITNLEEIKQKAPKSYQKMISNGLKMYRRDGGAFKASYLRYKKQKSL